MPGIDECLREAMSLPGALGAALVDWTSGLALGTAGRSPVGDHETTAAETAELARAAREYESFSPDAIPAALPPAPARAAGLPGVPDRKSPGSAPGVDGARAPGCPPGPAPGPAVAADPASGPPSGLTPVPVPGPTPVPTPGAPGGRGPRGGPAGGPHPGAPEAGDRPAPPAGPGTAAPLPAAPPIGVDPKAPPVEDVIVTTRTAYHVLRFVETTFDSSVFLHLWLDRSTGNLALARLRLRELAERLVLV